MYTFAFCSFRPLAQASVQLWYPLEVPPSLPLTQTVSLQAEEGTGPGARDHGLRWPRIDPHVNSDDEIRGSLLEPRINVLLGFLTVSLSS